MTAAVGGLALLLTLSGLFSVLSYIVEQRRKEIGVRMALGATAGNVMRLVVSQSLRPVALGLAAGGGLAALLATALMSTRAASQIGAVFNVLDPLTYIVSLLGIVTACVAAALIPALRATRIDPIGVLRQD
ncbi:MAG: FtsX-like permease family protein [Acidobacteriota bacterium]|nr:FtsX-like permease family protein [Acidobacteriota bacterium]